MSARAVITWKCEVCGKTVDQVEEDVAPYMDVVPAPPQGWGYLKDGNTHACTECLDREAQSTTSRKS